jgi:hypothetical protein
MHCNPLFHSLLLRLLKGAGICKGDPEKHYPSRAILEKGGSEAQGQGVDERR